MGANVAPVVPEISAGIHCMRDIFESLWQLTSVSNLTPAFMIGANSGSPSVWLPSGEDVPH